MPHDGLRVGVRIFSMDVYFRVGCCPVLDDHQILLVWLLFDNASTVLTFFAEDLRPSALSAFRHINIMGVYIRRRCVPYLGGIQNKMWIS